MGIRTNPPRTVNFSSFRAEETFYNTWRWKGSLLSCPARPNGFPGGPGPQTILSRINERETDPTKEVRPPSDLWKMD